MLRRRDAAKEILRIPVLGACSETWPLNCPKSDKIVRGFADDLVKPGSDKGFSSIGMLFLHATGEDKDLEIVRESARDIASKEAPTYAWFLVYAGIPLTEPQAIIVNPHIPLFRRRASIWLLALISCNGHF